MKNKKKDGLCYFDRFNESYLSFYSLALEYNSQIGQECLITRVYLLNIIISFKKTTIPSFMKDVYVKSVNFDKPFLIQISNRRKILVSMFKMFKITPLTICSPSF